MDPRPDRPILAPVGGSSRLPVRLAALAVVLIVLAVLKPWGTAPAIDSAPPSPAGPGPAASPAGGSRFAGATAPGVGAAPIETPNPDAVECLEPDGWRIVTLQRASRRESRSWTVERPTIASGPDDPGIDSVRLSGEDLVEVGFCAAGQGVGRSPAVITGAWHLAANGTWQRQGVVPVTIDGGGGFAMMTTVATPLGPGASRSPGGPSLSAVRRVPDPASGAAGLPAPAVPSPSSMDTSWPPGQYVFSVATGGTAPRTFWFGAEIVAPSVAPLVSPRPTH